MEEKVYINGYFNKTMQDVFVTNLCLNKINPSVCSVYDEVATVEDYHQREQEYVGVPPKGDKNEISH